MSKPTIVITVGDPAGIGPEIVKKTVSQKSVLKICNPVVIGSSKNFVPGKHSKKSDVAAVSFLNKAVELVKNGEADAIITAPVSKSAFGRIGGHTEFLANRFGLKNVEMLMVADNIKVLLLTRHIPLKDVSKNISTKKIAETTIYVCDFIKQFFRIKNPKIVICGLNPHCADNGLIGNDEKQKIIPAIQILKKNGFNVTGPVNPEIAFLSKNSDLIVCMYHDQAMLPLKILQPDKIVNVTVGLPFIRTSPGHGTAYDIAGKGIANPSAMIEAIKLAAFLTEGN
ncbi:MAG: 4-hydroxythreonine-4-phosphate dehydrogenase PdxA [Elusimicrobiota bacterium]